MGLNVENELHEFISHAHRRECLGELIQIDGSQVLLIEGRAPMAVERLSFADVESAESMGASPVGLVIILVCSGRGGRAFVIGLAAAASHMPSLLVMGI